MGLILELKAKIKMQDEQRNKLQQINATVTRQFREVIHGNFHFFFLIYSNFHIKVSSELTGYQIKMKDNNIYQVQSLYDREAERHFIFQVQIVL